MSTFVRSLEYAACVVVLITGIRAQAPRTANKRMILLLSADSPKRRAALMVEGQTVSVDQTGNVSEMPVPYFNLSGPVRYAYLTLIDTQALTILWTATHQWGGLLTGFNSAGERLIERLEKEMKKQLLLLDR
jgi:hypothetical protein